MKTRSGGPYECSRRSPPHVTDDCLSIYVVIMGSISWGDPQAMIGGDDLPRSHEWPCGSALIAVYESFFAA